MFKNARNENRALQIISQLVTGLFADSAVLRLRAELSKSEEGPVCPFGLAIACN
jgi:hypothetical protein